MARAVARLTFLRLLHPLLRRRCWLSSSNFVRNNARWPRRYQRLRRIEMNTSKTQAECSVAQYL